MKSNLTIKARHYADLAEQLSTLAHIVRELANENDNMRQMLLGPPAELQIEEGDRANG